MKTITLTLTEGIVTSKKEITEEQANAVREILKEEPRGKWVPKKGEKYFYVVSNGVVLCDTNVEILGDKQRIAQNNAFQTEEQAQAESLRREGSERRYLPGVDVGYKTVSFRWIPMFATWRGDWYDWTRYHNGMVWSMDTPDSEILAWVAKYRKAWETK